MAAEFELARLKQHFRRRPDQYRGPQPRRVYRCDLCDAWHLSSQEHAPVTPTAKLDAREHSTERIERKAVADVIRFVEALDDE